ncbi:MAG: hypothetical protein HYR55_17185 [Acidobacteria bacterium]|nr:hypothetical protein [Acidobacteriota bacterium]
MPFDYLDSIMEHRDRVRIPYDEQKARVMLSEDDPDSDIAKLEIAGFDSRCFAFRLDGLKKPHKTHLYLKVNAPDIHKGCDGVLIFRFKGRGYILFCELKSKRTAGFTKQLHSSQAFTDYLCSLAKRFGGLDLCDFTRVNVLFTTRPFANKVPFKREASYKGPMGDETLLQLFYDTNRCGIPRYHVNRLVGLG